MSKFTPTELLQREVDGENSPEESAGLQRLIAERPDLQERYAALKRLVTELSSLGEAEPPAELAAEVMRVIRRMVAGRVGGRSWVEALRAALVRRPAMSLAFGMAAGLVVGALTVGLAGPALLSRPDGPGAVGTILPSGRLTSLGEIDRQQISRDEVRGEVVIRPGNGRLLAEVRIESGKAVDVAFDFDPTAFLTVGFERDGDSLGEAVLGSGEVHLRQAGTGHYVLILGPSGSARPPLRLRLQTETGFLEKELRTGDGK